MGTVWAWVAVGLMAAPLQAQAPTGGQKPPSDSTKPVTLNPIEVSVTRSTSAIDHVPRAVAALDINTARAGRPALGLDEVLLPVPGVVVSNRYNPAQDQQVSIRGFGARSAFGVRGLKVLLDGIPQTLPDGQGQLTNLDLSEVSRIEVLRGASSALYGNASGGVVSIWTDQTPPVRVMPVVRTVGGAFGLFRWRVGGVAPVGRGNASLSVSRMTSDGFRDHSRTDLRLLSLQVTQSLSASTRLVVRGEAADNPVAQDPGALTSIEMNANPAAPNPANLTADVGKSVSQGQAGITIQHDASNGARFTATAFGLKRDLKNPQQFAYIDLGRWAYGLRTTAAVPARLGSRTAMVTVGADAQWQRDDRINLNALRTTLTRDQFERVSELGPFAQVAVELVPRATVTAGARYDRVAFHVADRFLSDGDDSGSRIMAALSGSAGLALRVHAALEPYVTVGTSFETPTTTELANRPTGPGGFNPVLDPQKGTNFEVGARGTLSRSVRYEAAAFRTNVRGELIPFETPGDPGRRFFQNAGSSSHSGIELGATVEPVTHLTFLAAYAWGRHKFNSFRTATDTLDGKQIPGSPRHYLHWSVAYRSVAGVWGAVDNTYASSYALDDRNITYNEPWWTTGIRVGYEGSWSGWRMAPFIGVLNLFDKHYAGSTVANARVGRYYEPAPGRNAYLGIEVTPAR